MKELYVAMVGASARETQMAMVANNLANVNSAGYKRQEAVFEVRPPEVDWERLEAGADAALRLPSPRQQIEGERHYVRIADSHTDFSGGNLQNTGRPLDLALDTRGAQSQAVAFFVLDTPQGERLTRAGSFQVNARGELVTGDGLAVQAKGGGALVVKNNASRPIHTGVDGTIFSGSEELGSLRIVVADDPARLARVGEGLYAATDGRGGVRDATAEDGVAVRDQFLEMSNVNVVDELVRMIDLQRSYSAFQKTIQSMDEASSRMIGNVLNG